MAKIHYKYIYGPVSSWRLGASLGIDPVSNKEKLCSFNCVYCQIGNSGILTDERRVFVPTEEIIREIRSLPPLEIDYITFSGRGEPTLAKNLGEMIDQIRKIRKEKIAVITNSSLLYRKDVQRDLSRADLVTAKLDACSEESFRKINKPMRGIRFDNVLEGIKKFRAVHKGFMALQIMFIEENKGCAEDLARMAKDIKIDEVQINTPLRPSLTSPLSREELDKIKESFRGMDISYVYDAEKKKTDSISGEDALLRRGRRDQG